MEQKAGKVFIFSAPSGSGKTTVVRHVLKKYPDFKFSVSATTRPPRHNEEEGVHYHFLTADSFKQKIEEGAFLEWEEVYQGRFYGTLLADVEAILNRGIHVLFDVDVKGGINIKKYYGDRAVAFFIEPPSLDTLRQRLEDRGTESQDEIERRCAKAAYEMQFASQFDHIILNDVLEVALKEVYDIVDASLKVEV